VVPYNSFARSDRHARCSDLKISSEFRLPVSSTSRVVHVGFLTSSVMVQAQSVSTHRLETDSSTSSAKRAPGFRQ
jgi:hypothetical protein